MISAAFSSISATTSWISVRTIRFFKMLGPQRCDPSGDELFQVLTGVGFSSATDPACRVTFG